jgi:galactitol-specific phosphotransferase system IIC component
MQSNYTPGWYLLEEAVSRLPGRALSVHTNEGTRRKGSGMLGTLLVIALLLLLFGVIGGVAISKFLFLVLIVAAVVALFGALSGRSA